MPKVHNWEEWDYWGGYSMHTNEEDGEDEDFEDHWGGDDPMTTLAGFQFGIGYGDDKLNIAFKLNKTGNFGEINMSQAIYGGRSPAFPMTGEEDDNKNLTLQLSTCIYF